MVKARAFAEGMIDSVITVVDLASLAKADWKIAYVDCFEPGEGFATHAIDGDPGTFWHSTWSTGQPGHPHEIQIDLAKPTTMTGFTYLPRQDMSNGRIDRYEFYVGVRNLTDYTQREKHIADAAFLYAPVYGRLLYGGFQLSL